MSGSLLRLGLWIVLITLAMYVVRDAFQDSAAHEIIKPGLLKVGVVSGLAIIAVGVVFSIFETAKDKATQRSRCIVCRQPIPRGEMYCRQHLRSILEEEHNRSRARKT